jgi:endonuclease-8
VWNTADLQRHPYLRRLGVELLSPETRVAHVAQQVNDQRWARKGVAGALLDQGFLAGVGN